MTKEQGRGTILEVRVQVAPNEDLSNARGDIPIRKQIRPDSVDFSYVIMELPKHYGVAVSRDDYLQSAISDSSIVYREPRTQGL